MDDIQIAQVVERLRKKGLLPPQFDPRAELGLIVVCNACGCRMDASWVHLDGNRQAVIVVEKCKCNSPLMEESPA